jgi:hypothetical protein
MIVYVDCVPKKTASVTFTLLEILTSILYSLGDMPYHLNSHLETIETVEQLRKVFDVDEDEIEDDEL